jgi:hypothetical protein
MGLIGCAGVRTVEIRSEPTPIYMLEQGRLKQLYPTSMHLESFRGAVIDRAYLTDKEIVSKSLDKVKLLKTYPPFRQLSSNESLDLLSVAQATAPRQEYRERPSPEKVYWILSNDPVVVGIGTKMLPPSEIVPFSSRSPITGMIVPPGTLRMITPPDISEEVEEVFCLPRWPLRGPLIGQGGDPDKMLADMVKEQIRHIRLSQPVPIQQLFSTQPWLAYKPVKTISLMDALRRYKGVGLKQAKQDVDDLLAGQTIHLANLDAEMLNKARTALEALGCVCR